MPIIFPNHIEAMEKAIDAFAENPYAMLMAQMARVPMPDAMPDDWPSIATLAGCGSPATGWFSEPDLHEVLARSGDTLNAVGEAIDATRQASALLA